MIRRVFSFIAVALTATTATLFAAAPPASALLSPYLEVNIITVSGGLRACARGYADPSLVAVSHWEFEVAGSRVDLVNPTIFYSAGRDGSTFPWLCVYVYKLGASSGEFTATLTFVSDGTDASRSTSGAGMWNPLLPDLAVSSSTCGTGCLQTTRTP